MRAKWNWASFAGSAEGLKWIRRDLPELDKIVAIVPRKRVAVQAGGNLGLYPKSLSESFDVVYAFEPSPELFPMFTANAPERNVVRFQAALGCTREFISTSRTRRDGKPNVHEGITHVSGPGVIPTMRLDDLGLTTCDLLTLDIEGSELAALRGSVDTLRRCRPVVAIEVNKNLKYVGVTEDELVGFVEAQGYRHAFNAGSDRAFVPVEWQ